MLRHKDNSSHSAALDASLTSFPCSTDIVEVLSKEFSKHEESSVGKENVVNHASSGTSVFQKHTLSFSST